ncbi:hypothetical protein ACWF95_08825 [Streptomyces vinaceus]|uniref:hypothetical protein n=1 Tax=unclassified Streptomyces TaxID=2593676 RepID=UPI00369DA8D7
MANAALAALAAYFLFLFWRSVRKKPGFASWHMFAGSKISKFSVRRRDHDGAPLNIWDFLPHTQVSMSHQESRFFLLYLARVHKMTDLRGTIDVRDEMSTFTLTVEDSHVVD